MEKEVKKCTQTHTQMWRILIYLCYMVMQFYLTHIRVMFYNFYTNLTGLILLEKLDTFLGIQILTRAKKLYDSPGMPRLCSISQHNPAWLELWMKFRANWETPQSHHQFKQTGGMLLPGGGKKSHGWILKGHQTPWSLQSHRHAFNPQPKLCSRSVWLQTNTPQSPLGTSPPVLPLCTLPQPTCNPSVLLSRDKDGRTWHFDASSEPIEDLKWSVCASTMTAQLQNVLFCNVYRNIHFISKKGEQYYKSVFRSIRENIIYDLSENKSWKADSELPVSGLVCSGNSERLKED